MITPDEIARLRKSCEWGQYFDVATARTALPSLLDEVERLREALKFYADGKHYIPARFHDPDVCIEDGERARKALEGK